MYAVKQLLCFSTEKTCFSVTGKASPPFSKFKLKGRARCHPALTWYHSTEGVKQHQHVSVQNIWKTLIDSFLPYSFFRQASSSVPVSVYQVILSLGAAQDPENDNTDLFVLGVGRPSPGSVTSFISLL